MMVTLLDKIINKARVVEVFSRTKDRDSWLEASQQLENLKGELLVTIARLTAELEAVMFDRDNLLNELKEVKEDRWCLRGDRMENCGEILKLRAERDEAMGKVVEALNYLEAIYPDDTMSGVFYRNMKRILGA
jgi:uncharacterized coiled-coil DUF342 family protein